MSTPTNIDSHRSRMLSALLPKSCSALRVLGLPIGNPVMSHFESNGALLVSLVRATVTVCLPAQAS